MCSRSRHALLNGDTKHYDWDHGYTCHQLGSGAILIQLGQPYIISSLRLLLWDCDDRSYSYFIESSVNVWDWEVLVDRTRENCQSWQVVRFAPRPVVFIRIVGTRNTANEVRIPFTKIRSSQIWCTFRCFTASISNARRVIRRTSASGRPRRLTRPRRRDLVSRVVTRK